jgi:hypothetical protein
MRNLAKPLLSYVNIPRGQERDMHKRSRLTIALVTAAAIALSIVTNIATNSMPHRFRPPIWSVWITLAVLAVLVVAAEARSSRHHSEIEATKTPGDADLSDAAAVLARAVREQWHAEAVVRSLNEPEPIRVRWSSTARPIAASPSSILGPAAPEGRILRLHLRGDVTQVVEMFRRLPRHQLVILGAPGAGKSALALLFTLKILATREEGAPVPLLLSLSSWDPRREYFLVWIARRIVEDYPGLANADLYGQKAPWRLVSEGRIIPILDGLDEIPSELRGESISGIGQTFGPGQPFVITCRIEEYEKAIEDAGQVLGSAAVVEILPIDNSQIISYLSGLGPVSQARWEPIFARLREDPNGPIAMALSTPLTVWLARIAYSDIDGRPEELLDDRLFSSREAIEDHLLDKFIPAVYRFRPPGPGDRARMRVSPNDAERWLKFLARSLSGDSKAARRGLATGDQTDIAWWRVYQTVPPFELGLAAFLIVGPMIILPLFLTLGITSQLTIRRLLALGICIGIVLCAGVAVIVKLWPPPPGRIQIRFPKRGQLPGNLQTAILYGSLAAATASVAASLGALVLKGYEEALRFGFECGFLAGAVVFLVAVLNGPVDTVKASSPELILKGDRAVSVAAGVLTAPAVGLTAWILLKNTGESIGAAASSAIGVSIAMSSWGWFFVATIWLWLRRRLPLNLMKFWLDAYGRGVLRLAGAVYQFRHARLQGRLADSRSDELKSED